MRAFCYKAVVLTKEKRSLGDSRKALEMGAALKNNCHTLRNLDSVQCELKMCYP